MVEGPEIEDQVDLDDDNYSEEIDDDLDDQLEYEAPAVEEEEGDGNDKGGNQQEEDEEEEDDEDDDGIRSDDDSEKDRLVLPDEEEANGSRRPDDRVEEEEEEEAKSPPPRRGVPINEEDKEKYDELLSLPPRGSEVFIGGLPRDVSDEDLRDLCEPFGDIFEIKLVKNRETGESKGFAFVAFRTKEVAQLAIKELNSKDFKGRTIRCSLSDTKYRLFIGNVPKSWTDDEFRNVIEETGPGAENIELIKDPQAPSRNRGFAFVEYYNNACADYSRKKMTDDSFKLDGNSPTVTWADPKSTPDHSPAASQVKALYVKNIPENTPLEELKQLFQRHGDVTKVVMPPAKSGGKRDFGFIHYAERSSALKAVKDSEKYEINDQVLEVCLAKPQSDKKFDVSNPYGSGAQPNYIAHPGFPSFATNPYAPAAPLGGGYGVPTGFQQPVIFGRGPMPSGMHMVPMVLPNGQIGYVLQQPGVQMAPQRPQAPQRGGGRRNDWNNGGSGEMQSRGRSSGANDDSSRSKRHRPSY